MANGWVKIGASGGGGATNLDGLSDVVITAAAQGDILTRDGTDWDNTNIGTNQVVYRAGSGNVGGLAMAASTFLARLATGDIVAATVAQVKTLLAIVAADISDFAATARASLRLYLTTTQVEVVNTVTETTLFSFTLPGGTLSTNRLVLVHMMVSYLNNSAANTTLTYRLKLGATTMVTVAISSITSDASRSNFPVTFEIKGDGATNAQEAHGSAQVHSSTNVVRLSSGTGVAAEDSTGNLTLAVTVQHGNAHANISARMEAAYVEGPLSPA